MEIKPQPAAATAAVSEKSEQTNASRTRSVQSPYADWIEEDEIEPTTNSYRRTYPQQQLKSRTPSSTSNDHLPFDEEFQHLVSQITDERILKEEASFRAISRLTRDFRFAAMTYGKVIIAEKDLEFKDKTIKPSCELPGVAGGEKYVAGGILFRFAVDRNQIYGSDEFAGKVRFSLLLQFGVFHLHMYRKLRINFVVLASSFPLV